MKDDAIASLDRALSLLLTIYESGEEMGITELSDALGVYKSTVFRTLKTMENRGFIRQNPQNEKYWFGLKLYAIGLLVADKLQLKDIAGPYTQKLYARFHETVNVSILEPVPDGFHRSIIVHKEFTPGYVLSANQPIGSSSPCYCSSVGKCLLAFTKGLDYSIYFRNTMPRYTDFTITDGQSLLEELTAIREQGYAVDHGELELGLSCVGVPILERNGNAIAAMSISGPTARLDDASLQARIDLLRECAQQMRSLF